MLIEKDSCSAVRQKWADKSSQRVASPLVIITIIIISVINVIS